MEKDGESMTASTYTPFWPYGPKEAPEEHLQNMIKERDFLLLQLERLEENILQEKGRIA
jgi:hypothetical protein